MNKQLQSKEHYIDVNKSVYQFQQNYTNKYKRNYAYRFFYNNISYKTSAQQIENIANYLYYNLEVKPGEVVAVISPGLPEVVSSFYGINKNGAIFFPIDPRNNATKIRDFLNLANVRQVFMFDQAFIKVDSIIDQTKVENVTVLSVKDSMFPILWKGYHNKQMKQSKLYQEAINAIGMDNISEVAQKLENLKKLESLTSKDVEMIKNLEIYIKMREPALKNLYYTNPPKEGYISFRKAMKLSENSDSFSAIYNDDVPASITLTGGTTGVTKVVPTMNKSFNIKVRDYSYTSMPIEKQDRMLAMPPFIMYGEVFMHMAYVMGVQNVIIPDVTQFYYPDIIIKNRINHVVGVPSQALTFPNDEKLMNQPPKFIKTISVGGTRMLGEHEREINSFANKIGISVTQGYSMTELTPSSMTNLPGETKEGSVGKPLGNVDAIILDSRTKEILGANEQGSLYINSETQFNGYYKNEEETAGMFLEKNGKKYVNTGDQAYFDEEGFYFIVGRDKEMIIRPDGHNNFPSIMEEIIVTDYAVQDCAVVGYPFPNYDSPTGEYPKAHVVLKEQFVGKEAEVEMRLRELCLENLPERDVPYYYEFHKELPMTPVLKPDKLALKRMDKEQAVQKIKKYK